MCFNGITSDLQPFQRDTLQRGWGWGWGAAWKQTFKIDLPEARLTFDMLDPDRRASCCVREPVKYHDSMS